MPCERGKLTRASDGLPARCVGPWSEDKLYYIQKYLEVFSTAMKGKFARRAYIDLFAGPGRCVTDDNSRELDGSPLKALRLPFQFTEYHFVEAEPKALAALKARVEGEFPRVNVKYYAGDANDLIPQLKKDLPQFSLDVAVVDPTGLHLRFENLKLLTEGRRIDLIYLFPEGMDVKRNLETYLEMVTSPLDEVLDSREWRSRVLARRTMPERDEEQHWEEMGRPIVELLRKQLAKIGYEEVMLGSEIVVRNRKDTPLYYLLFASKNRLGHKFWDEIRKVSPSGQRELPLK